MDESGQPSLTEFLLDLSESEELSKEFFMDRLALISARGLERYRDLLVEEPIDVQKLRDEVRAEVTGRPGQQVPGREPREECIIYGIRKPPPPPPPPH